MNDPIPARLRKEPLLEALWEVRFSSDRYPVGDLLPGLVYQALAKHYGKLTRLPAANVPHPIAERDEALRHAPTVRLEGEPFSVQLGERVVSLSCRRPYAGWATFSSRIRAARARAHIVEAHVFQSPDARDLGAAGPRVRARLEEQLVTEDSPASTTEWPRMGGALVTASLVGLAAVAVPAADPESWALPSSAAQIPVTVRAETATSGTQVHATARFPSDRPEHEPRTALGMRLWSWDEVVAEVRERRGERENG